MKKAVIGVLAHVDAGKTTLCEAMLTLAGVLRTQGRVDHGDTCMDNHPLERARGITIFSQQATLTHGDFSATMLDTPGHVDFSTEMERALQILDCAVLVISGTDGVQAHTRTLWRLLRLYSIPTFVFVTKMDVSHRTRTQLLEQLQTRLTQSCVDFSVDTRDEQLALCDETVLEQYLQTGEVTDAQICTLVASQKVTPCLFGSGLQMQGVSALLDALADYAPQKEYSSTFSARVWKITHDERGERLTHLKLTGGSLAVKELVAGEKINQLRRYFGAKFTTAERVEAGTVCAVTGLTKTFAGQSLGSTEPQTPPQLAPVMTYRLELPSGCDVQTLLPKLQLLAQEEPSLHVCVRAGQLHVQLMGEIQAEILLSLVRERFGVELSLAEGRILYRETIAAPVEGVGHFEPLRHYAEVHLLLEPLTAGSGLQFRSVCREDVLERNWQRLILTHLQEKEHLGVLTGSPITDMRLTLCAGRAHSKHTEGGDFRQATYRAVRQGLMQAESVLLEPVCTFRLELPPEQLGRAINDIRAAGGSFTQPQSGGALSVLEGSAPYAAIGGYGLQVAAYTGGRGVFSCELAGYAPCRNAAQIIEKIAYAPEADLENTPDSVFCSHGAGVNVKWDKVQELMHLPSCLKPDAPDGAPRVHRTISLDERELEAIMTREFGPIRRPMYRAPERAQADEGRTAELPRPQILFIDGYNVIFSFDELRVLAEADLEGARTALMNRLCNYAAFTKCRVVLVFDAYQVAKNPGTHSKFHNLEVVFTKQNETCDAYLERLVYEIGKNEQVRVVTSDALIQLSAVRSGVLRMSASEFEAELDAADVQIEAFLRTLRAQRMGNVADNTGWESNHGAR